MASWGNFWTTNSHLHSPPQGLKGRISLQLFEMFFQGERDLFLLFSVIQGRYNTYVLKKKYKSYEMSLNAYM